MECYECNKRISPSDAVDFGGEKWCRSCAKAMGATIADATAGAKEFFRTGKAPPAKTPSRGSPSVTARKPAVKPWEAEEQAKKDAAIRVEERRMGRIFGADDEPVAKQSPPRTATARGGAARGGGARGADASTRAVTDFYARTMEAERKSADEQKRKAEEDKRRKEREDADRKRREDEQRKREDEQKRKTEEEKRRKEREDADRKKREDEQKRKAEEEKKKKAAAAAKNVPPPPASRRLRRAIAIYDYAASRPDEMTLKEGDIVSVLEDAEDGWSKGELGSKKGWFPSQYVEPYEEKGGVGNLPALGAVEESVSAPAALAPPPAPAAPAPPPAPAAPSAVAVGAASGANDPGRNALLNSITGFKGGLKKTATNDRSSAVLPGGSSGGGGGSRAQQSSAPANPMAAAALGVKLKSTGRGRR